MIIASWSVNFMSLRTSTSFSLGPGTKSCFSVTNCSWPLVSSRTRAACSSSISTAFFTPPSRTTSSGPGKAILSPRYTVTWPVMPFSNRTYSLTFSTHALAFGLSIFQVGSKKMSALPRCTQRFPVAVSFNFMYSSSWSTIDSLNSTRVWFGPGTHNCFSVTSCSCPVVSSRTRAARSSSISTAFFTPPSRTSSSGPGKAMLSPRYTVT
mmetsp:Transcript_155555/g.282928  ORF Transcript_155555/g.282928 Transcript_155555/m.282928 type:complete len:209 (+) Transcript_155555:1082-1708(+)